MPRKATTLGPSRLSRILVDLRRVPRLELSASLESLKLTLAARNDHFGARHFVKEELPRIRYANPTLNIEVFKVPKSKTDIWQPEMSVKFADSTTTIPLASKWSTTITKDLMDLAGTPSWFHWKKQAIENGKLVVPGEELEGIKRVKTVPKAKSPGRPSLKVKPIMDAKEGIETLGEVIPARPKTGAAAVLP